MTAAELDAMVGEIVSLLHLQPMTALGLTTLDAETFWQIMRRVQGRLIREGCTVTQCGARRDSNG